MTQFRITLSLAVFAFGLGALGGASAARAHCDGLDGPVVVAAREALDQSDVNRVLIWVQPDDEAGIRQAFDRAMNVRKLGPEARELADTYFFETLVRTHRAGEGAGFTGLKPAGRDLGPAIPAADRALASGNVDPLVRLVVDRSRDGLVDRFEAARAARKFPANDVARGREYVERYVAFIHYVEGLHEAASRRVEGHYPEAEPGEHHP
jgi:hypothetical protein